MIRPEMILNHALLSQMLLLNAIRAFCVSGCTLTFMKSAAGSAKVTEVPKSRGSFANQEGCELSGGVLLFRMAHFFD